MVSMTIDRRDGLNSSSAIKGPCRVATTANVALSGLQVIDGVQTVEGDRVLVRVQDDARDNGIRIVSTGNWERSADFRNNRDLATGTQVYVSSGTLNGGRLFGLSTTGSIAIGTSNITFTSSVVTQSELAARALGFVSTRAALKALDTTKHTVAYLTEVGREGHFKWTLGDYSAQITADTAEGIYIKADGIAATVGAWVRQYNGRPFADWWGAAADYTIGGTGTDDTASIQCAVNVCNLLGEGELRFRSRGGKKYLVTDTITGTALFLSGVLGAGIVFKNMDGLGGFTFTGATSVGKTIGAENLDFIVEGANILHAVKGPQQADQYATYYTRYRFVGNYFRGANRVVSKYSFAWDYTATNWIHIGDSIGGEVYNNQIWGAYDIKADPAGQHQDCGIRLEAASATLAIEIGHNKIGTTYAATEIANRSFFHFFGNDCIGNHIGLRWLTGTNFNEPKVFNNNFNSQRYGIYIDGPDSITISGNTIRRHRSGWKMATADWYGIYAANVSDLHMSDNAVQPDEGDGVYSGVMYAYYLSACSIGSAIGNFVGVGNDRGYLLDNCTGLTISGTKTAQNAASDILFRLINNTRSSNLGDAVYVSSFVGSKITDDGTVSYTGIDADKLLGIRRLPESSLLTISSGAVTISQSFHLIDTEAAAGSDDLDTINAPAYMTSGAPTYVSFRASSSSRDVVFKNATGNMRLAGDFTLTHSADWIELIYENGVWKEVGRSDNTA